MAFIGVAVSYASRFTLPIGIVAMVAKGKVDKPCLDKVFYSLQLVFQIHKRMRRLLSLLKANARASTAPPLTPQQRLVTSPSLKWLHFLISGLSLPKQNGEFDWDPETQGLILGCFFYGYSLTHVPGGILAERYGGKWFMGMYYNLIYLITLISRD